MYKIGTLKRIAATLLVFTSIFFLTTFLQSAEAHEVTKVKGKKVLIMIEDGAMKKGMLFYTLTSTGKKKGIIKILKVKNSRAIGKLMKGKAKPGYTLLVRKKKSKTAKKGKKKRGKRGKKSRASEQKTASMYWGGMLGFAQNTMSVKFPNDAGTADLSGSGMSAKGLFDFALFSSLWFRGLVGAETFDVKGTATQASCNSSTDCKVTLTYLTADLWGRFIFSKGSFRPWGGAGFLLLFPMTKDVTALDEKSVTNTSNFALGLGFDWYIGKSSFIPFQVEYDLYPSSEQVTANSIAVRIGFGMEL